MTVEKITDSGYFLPATGPTKGNSIVVVEKDGLLYLMHGDVTYTDAAFRAEKNNDPLVPVTDALSVKTVQKLHKSSRLLQMFENPRMSTVSHFFYFLFTISQYFC